jgi:hypothetical protein
MERCDEPLKIQKAHFHGYSMGGAIVGWLLLKNMPMLAINGEYDRPNARTHRMWRELNNFTNVVVDGKCALSRRVARSALC